MAWPTPRRLLLCGCLVVLQSLVLAGSNEDELHIIQASAEPLLLTVEALQQMYQMFKEIDMPIQALAMDDTSGACLTKAVSIGILDLWLTTVVPQLDRGAPSPPPPQPPPDLPAGVIVTDCDFACRLVPGFYGSFGVTSLALGCSSESFKDRTAFPNLIAIMSPFSSLSEPILQFMKRFHWKSIVICSTAKDDINLSAQAIRKYLKSKSIRVVEYTILKPRESDEEIKKIVKEIQKQSETILVLLLPLEDRMKFLEVANASKMLNGDYAILAIHDLAEKYGTTSPEIVKGWQNGLVLMNPWQATDPSMDRLKSRLPIPNVGYLVDAVKLISSILFLTQQSKQKKEKVPNIVDILQGITFSGSSGNVAFDKEGLRRMPYRFSNVRNGEKVEVMSASFENDLVELPKSQFTKAIRSMIWPGGTTETPSDTNVPNTVWWKKYKEYLIPAGGTFLAMAFVIFLFYLVNRYLKYRHLLNSTKDWIIPWNELETQNTTLKKSVPSIANTSHSESATRGSSDDDSIRIDFTTNETDERKLFEAIYQSNTVLVHLLSCQNIDLTNEGIIREIQQTMNLRHENIVRYIGLCPYQPNAAIIMSVAKRGTLRDLLRASDSRLLTLDFMASLLRDAAMGMEYLHSTEIGSHGCLTSARCVIDSRWTCQIAGCGFRLLKKCRPQPKKTDQLEDDDYKEMLWTAPELLRIPEKSRPLYGTKEGDVYSYAIILQEVVYGGEPFPDESKNYFYKEIVLQIKRKTATAFRPLLTGAQCKPEWINLIERCWIETPSKRPTFRKIVQDLDNVSEAQDNAGLIENLVVRTEKYALNLTDLVQQATSQLDHERQKGYDLLFALLPRYVASKLEEGQTLAAESFESTTMCFADIVGFTKIAAASTPMQVIELLSALYSAYDEITSRHDTYKVETIGDCYVVASGLPVRNGNQHAMEIANLALDVLAFVKSFTIAHLSQTSLQIRIGVHSGPAVAGIVGVKTPRYAVFGVTSAIAEKLEASAEPNTIHITEVTADILRETQRYELQERGRETLKGISLKTYYLLDYTKKWKKQRRAIELAKDLPTESPKMETPRRVTVEGSGKHSRSESPKSEKSRRVTVEGSGRHSRSESPKSEKSRRVTVEGKHSRSESPKMETPRRVTVEGSGRNSRSESPKSEKPSRRSSQKRRSTVQKPKDSEAVNLGRESTAKRKSLALGRESTGPTKKSTKEAIE